MAVRRFTQAVGPGRDGVRLDAVLLDWLPAALARPVSKSTIRRLIIAGAIRVDGRPVRRPAMTLAAHTRLEALVDEHRLPSSRTAAEFARQLDVLFEDEALVAVAKPAGLSTHATADPDLPDLYTMVRGRRADTTRYLGLHHRLDRDTSGIVLFTKTPAANSALAAQFERRTIEKIYHALTVRPAAGLPSAWQIRDALAQVGRGRAARTAAVPRGGQPAETSFSVVERLPEALLVEARPHSGRKHQVRAHLSGGGTPILGDTRYGGPARVGCVVVGRPMLHARRLLLTHPLTGEPLQIECDYPEDFRGVLLALRRR